MFGHLMTRWLYLVKGRNLPQELQMSSQSISGVYNLWKSSKSDMKFYVNGRSTSIRVEELAALKCQYLNKCRDKTQTASSSHRIIFALR